MKRKTAKEILAESFKELAQTKKIDKITVKDITENCGYSSATFYRQFKDKYDLIAWSYTQDIRSIVDKLEYTEGSWKKVLTEVAKYFDTMFTGLRHSLISSNASASRTGSYSSFDRRIAMNEREVILEAMKKAGEPLNAGKVAELTGLDRKVVDKAFAAMKKDGTIVSPVRCKWEPANK